MTDSAVVTVGTLRAGTNENVIPDEALLRLTVRTFKQEVRQRVLAAIRRILEAEATASGAPKPPEFSVLSEFEAVVNDEPATRAIVAAFERQFGSERVQELSQPASASEDFSAFGPALGAPSVYWFVGGTDSATFAAAEKAGTVDDLPSNHAPNFAPVIDPTLRTGVEALTTAAGVWLGIEGARA
ncbi:MAG TPA: M20/M25/M40 family metallo-hydrolase [Rhodopila sp.]